MAILLDWVKQTTASTGTGTITLGAAVSGFIRFQDDTRLTDGSQVYYTIEDGLNRERGIGTYTASGTTLSRDVIHATVDSGTYTENPGTGLSLSGSAIVSCSAIANTHNQRICRVHNNNTTETLTANTWLNCSFSTADTDQIGCHDPLNPTYLTIPAGVSKISAFGAVEFAGTNTNNVRAFIFLAPSDLSSFPAIAYTGLLTSSTYISSYIATLTSGVVDVSAGQKVGLRVIASATGKTVNQYIDTTWLQIEVVE